LTTALQRLKTKNLTPWRDSNPVSSVLLADAMTTVPRFPNGENFVPSGHTVISVPVSDSSDLMLGAAMSWEMLCKSTLSGVDADEAGYDLFADSGPRCRFRL
jgi:hypothetical protein